MSHASSKCMWLMLVVVVCSILVDAHAHDDEHTPHHRCVHDELMQLMREERGNTALPLVRTGANVVGAALADGDTEASTHEKVWAPIRIKVFTPDLHPSQTGETSYCSAAGQTRSDFINSRMVCTKDDILTDEKRQIIEELLVPAAVQLHQERLLVEPTVGPIHIPHMSSSWSVCGHYNIPRVHASEGVFGADFILYISSVPTDVGVAAWAITCFNFNGGRPAVAVANINPRNVGADRRTIRTLAHEILHGLGFYYTTFTSDKMVSMVSGLRGRPGVVPLMTTQPVIEAARTHFQCDDMIGMELESDGGSGTMGSHWKRRNAKDELMAPVTNYGGFYTALTIAAMESFPFYKGNYSNAETMSWGYNAGCTLLNEKCVENGVSHYPSMFCADKRSDRCNSNRFGLGYCTLADFTSPLPSYYRYFSSPITGGSAILMEYCPIVQMYSNGGCETGNERVLRGSILSSTSRCLDAPSGVVVYPGYRVAALCAEVKCDNAQHQYSVLIKGSTTWVKCPVGGVISPSSLSKVFVYGEISCPPFKEVCQNSGTADRDASSARSNSHSQPPSPTKEADSSPTTTSSPDSVEKPSIASKVLAAILLCGLYIALLFRLYVLTMM